MVATCICTLEKGRAQHQKKKHSGSCQQLCLGEGFSFSPHPEAQQFSSPFMSLSPLQLLIECWSSESVILWVSPCAVPLRGVLGSPTALHLTQSQSLLVFSQKL